MRVTQLPRRSEGHLRSPQQPHGRAREGNFDAGLPRQQQFRGVRGHLQVPLQVTLARIRGKDDSLAFVCFKQKKDPNNKRGYSQNSFLVLTRLPFLRFFEQLSEFLVFKLFALEEAAMH